MTDLELIQSLIQVNIKIAPYVYTYLWVTIYYKFHALYRGHGVKK